MIDKRRVMYFDTETTGLVSNPLTGSTRQPHIIEFFAHVRTSDSHNNVTRFDYDKLFNPPTKLSDKVVEITGLTDEVLARDGAQLTSDAIIEIIDLIQTCDLVIAHNLSFDKAMVNIEAHRHGLKIAWPIGLCTVEETEWMFGRRAKLSELYWHLIGREMETAHRARDDVMHLVECCEALHAQGLIE